jgi:hypothetical protein
VEGSDQPNNIHKEPEKNGLVNTKKKLYLGGMGLKIIVRFNLKQKN